MTFSCWFDYLWYTKRGIAPVSLLTLLQQSANLCSFLNEADQQRKKSYICDPWVLLVKVCVHRFPLLGRLRQKLLSLVTRPIICNRRYVRSAVLLIFVNGAFSPSLQGMSTTGCQLHPDHLAAQTLQQPAAFDKHIPQKQARNYLGKRRPDSLSG